VLHVAKARNFVDQCWGDEVIPALVEYIKIPNKSPSTDADFAELKEHYTNAQIIDIVAVISLCPELNSAAAEAMVCRLPAGGTSSPASMTRPSYRGGQSQDSVGSTETSQPL
jgi:hypothetical protein